MVAMQTRPTLSRPTQFCQCRFDLNCTYTRALAIVLLHSHRRGEVRACFHIATKPGNVRWKTSVGVKVVEGG